MILEGNQRAGAKRLADHLMNMDDNDHVTVHEINGLIADNVHDALAEMDALSYMTKCKQFMFSVSLNPPEHVDAPASYFEDAIARIEEKLGLSEQARVVVFHEKNGRRHAHCVWSRIDLDQEKAINLPHYKRKLTQISKELYLDYGWDMPQGFVNHEFRNPLNFTRAEWQQAKRSDDDPRMLKLLLKSLWDGSDSKKAFEAALKEHGFWLAKGDRRGFVAVDYQGEIFSLSRWIDVKPKDLKLKLGDPKDLPSVSEVKAEISKIMTPVVEKHIQDVRKQEKKKLIPLYQALLQMKERQKAERQALDQKHQHNHEKALQEAKTQRNQDLTSLSADHQSEKQALIARQNLEEKEILKNRKSITAFLQKHPINPKIKADFEENIIKRHAVFTQKTVQRLLEKQGYDQTEIDLFFEQMVEDKGLISLGKKGREIFYTTPDMREAENHTLNMAQTLSNNNSHKIKPDTVQTAIQNLNDDIAKATGGKGSMSDNQEKALHHLLQDRQLSALVGIAGSGKSTILSGIKQTYEIEGYRVRGCALSGIAASNLSDSNINASTIHGLLHKIDLAQEIINKNQNRILSEKQKSIVKDGALTKKDVIIIDEAGMIPTVQMNRLLDIAKNTGAKLIMVGDPEQLQPIDAGAPFRDILKITDHIELNEVRRQKQPFMQEATQYFAKGETEKALDLYAKHKAIKKASSPEKSLEKLVKDYMSEAKTKPDTSRIALAHSRKDVESLNNMIKNQMVTSGLVQSKHYDLCKDDKSKTFSIKDKILFKRNDHKIGVSNGTLGIIDHIQKDKSGYQVYVTLENGKKIQFSTEYYDHIDLGYAVTIHKSQGVTVEQSYVLGTRSFDKHLTYVAMSRHKEKANFYTAEKSLSCFARDPKRYSISDFEQQPEQKPSLFTRLKNSLSQIFNKSNIKQEKALHILKTKQNQELEQLKQIHKQDVKTLQQEPITVTFPKNPEYEALIKKHLQERQKLQTHIKNAKRPYHKTLQHLRQRVAMYQELGCDMALNTYRHDYDRGYELEV